VGCGGEDDREPVWRYISPVIIQPNCATSSCHSKGAAVAGLNLSTAEDGHDGLTTLEVAPNAPGSVRPRPLVQPYNPDQSRVVNMLRAMETRRMPPDRPLAEADIVLIERWILNGAKRD
jgi:hypothetical protein